MVNKQNSKLYLCKNQGLEGFSRATINKKLPKDMKNIYISNTKKLNNNKYAKLTQI